MRKGCGGHFKIAILARFWTSDVHENAASVTFRGAPAAPPPPSERDRKKSERKKGREREDLQM